MIIEALPPALIMILAGLVLPLFSEQSRQPIAVLSPLAALWAVWQIPDGPMMFAPFLDYTLVPVEGDSIGRLFATVFTLMGFAGGVFAMKQPRVMELSAALIYSGGAVGCAFAGDLITLFIFWEIMALASTAVIWSSDQSGAKSAGFRYVLVHLFGGVVLMAGITAHVTTTGSVDFVAMKANSVGTWLILIGFLVNAGAPPFSAWLADAYPEGSFSGTVFLSAFTTKTAVMVLLKGFPGESILIWVGLYMVFYGIIYALLENDMRRILSYSIINQVGFMVCGIGIGTDMALNGAAAHAFAHIIYKGLLLMSAGSVLMMTGGRRKCTDLGGLFQSMPLTTICGTIGAFAISAFPLTSGFVTKSMIAQGAADEHMVFVWACLAAASAGVFLHAGIKFPWFVFFQKDQGLRPPDPPWNMRAAMIFMAALCIGIGIWPDPIYAILPFDVDYSAYTGAHLVSQLQLLLFAGLAFFVMLPLMKRTETISLDFDWFYRRFVMAIASEFRTRGGAFRHNILGYATGGIQALIRRLEKTHGPAGLFGRPWPTSLSVLSVTVLLCLYLILFYSH
ncbi:MAG: Na(+)/H(+) antiporter subunit D [Rhodospirillum sp.]|nr:Na(+)/H(+) antiporter subunit D [Rhodospirillum sp.]MCF8487836.1 Na(+)/H(+) antiporter subunit D [Rhodospirillum sp.]MCF8502628.1 Na(+)/H(+) antiporter subunit D [Rhodospirillum sp.]